MSLLIPRPPVEHASVVLPSITCSSCGGSIPLSSLGEHICRPQHAPRSNPPRPAFAGPSSTKSSPGPTQLTIPDLPSGRPSPSPSKLSPHSASSGHPGRSPSPRTPSPTNPFFPGQVEIKGGPIALGLGLTVASRPEGPFPTDAPLPAGISDLSMINTDSNGGMAGVGRRAFQAAAWGVTASVAMAQTATRSKSSDHGHGSLHPHQIPPQPRSAGAQPTQYAPWQQQPQYQAQAQHQHSMPDPERYHTPSRQRSGTDSNGMPEFIPHTHPSHRPALPPRSASAMDRPAHTEHPARSTSAMGQRHGHKPSMASSTSSRSEYDAGDSIATLLKARTDKRQAKDKSAFFDRYKEMQRSNSGGRLGLGRGSDQLVSSPQETTLDLDAYDEETSALPWATPALADSPEIKQEPMRRNDKTRLHQRYPTAESESSSHSSGSGRYPTSGPSEEVVTPSQSFEGLVVPSRKNHDPRHLRQIHETDEMEEDRVVFEASSRSQSRSRSNSTTKDTLSHSRPPVPALPSARTPTSRSHSVKTCQKCSETVGGSRKFVERDGVVLCEYDWKKMYLPSCRRCNRLIETKMVSADDGQLKGKWHAACFTCTRCDQPFEGKDFYVHAGRPWCQYHYAEET